MNPAIRHLLLQGAPGWVLQGAAIDLDFANNRTYGAASFDAVLTCSRASTGYGTDSAGNLISFATNTLRRTDLGLLIEEARTNIPTQSQTFSTWQVQSATLTTNFGTAPDGTSTAAQLAITSNSGNNLAWLYTSTAAQSYVATFYVKGTLGQQVFLSANSSGAGANQSTITFTGNWQRVTSNVITGTGISSYAGFEIFNRNGGAHLSNVTFQVWGGQLENAAFASSYIPTTTVSVTRAADVVTVGGTAFNLLNASSGSTVMSLGLTQNTASGVELLGGANNEHFKLNGSASQIRSAFSLGLNATLGSGSFGVSSAIKVGVAWGASSRSLVGNDGTVATDAPSLTANAIQYIGNNNGNSAIDGYIKRLSIWNTILADATLKALTA